MVGALAFVLVRSLRGRIIQMARRLKNPRYLFGFLVGGGWVLFWASRVFFGSGWSNANFQFGPDAELLQAAAGPIGQALEVVLATFLAIGGILWWAVPFGRNSLQFTEPELHLLLPSPVSRRALIQYGVVKSQPGVLVGVVIGSIFMGPGTLWGTAATLLALWMFFTLWDLHAKGRGLWYARLGELAPGKMWRTQIGLWLLLLGALVTLALLALQLGLQAMTLPFPDFEPDTGAALLESAEMFAGIAWNSALAWALAPIIWLIQPFFHGVAGDLGLRWLLTLAFPAAVLFAHNEWVVRSQSRFEETALAQARKRNKEAHGNSSFWRRTRARRRWEPFRLAPDGRPETAILWKNLMLAQRLPLKIAVGAPVAIVIVLLAMMAFGLVAAWVVVMMQGITLMLMMVGPLFSARGARNDFRADLLRLEIMRTMPITGLRMFLAQISAPVLVAVLPMLFGALVFIGIDALRELGLAGNAASDSSVRALAVAAEAKARVAEYLHADRLVLAPLALSAYLPIGLAVALLTASLENVAALAFPGWVRLGTAKKQAAAKFGQHMLVFMALSIVMFAGLVPGVLAVAAIVTVQTLVWGIPISAWELPLLGLAGAIPIGAVVVALAVFGGHLWDRLDPSAEMLAGRS